MGGCRHRDWGPAWSGGWESRLKDERELASGREEVIFQAERTTWEKGRWPEGP